MPDLDCVLFKVVDGQRQLVKILYLEADKRLTFKGKIQFVIGYIAHVEIHKKKSTSQPSQLYSKLLADGERGLRGDHGPAGS